MIVGRVKEPMKHRLKRKQLWKYPLEVYFNDDITEQGNTGRDVMRILRNKPHSHAGGRKPRWRAERKEQRNMKLHRDGTIEGTPNEIAEYNKLQEKKPAFKHVEPVISGAIKAYELKDSIYVGTTPSAATYLERFMEGIYGNKGNLH